MNQHSSFILDDDISLNNSTGFMTVGVVSYSEAFSISKLFLLETDEETLQEMENGRVYIKGDGPATLVTGSKTFSMKYHDNSNLQYVIGNLTILGSTGSLIRLERVLRPSVSSELLNSSSADQLARIEYHTPASAMEISSFLRDDQTVVFTGSGVLRLDEDFRLYCLDQIMNILNCMDTTARGWEVEEVWLRLADLLGEGDVLGIEGVRSVMRSLENDTDYQPEGSRRASLRESLGGLGRFVSINSAGVKRVRLQQVLHREGDGIPVDIAISEWRRLVHISPGCENTECDETAFYKAGEGLVVEELSGGKRIIRRCDINNLSSQPRDRLKQLFSVKKQWTREQLAIYLTPVFPAGTNIDSFLLKATRAVVTKGSDGQDIRVYTSLF